jgi:hypothetical protein
MSVAKGVDQMLPAGIYAKDSQVMNGDELRADRKQRVISSDENDAGNLRTHIIDWLTANGINANHVPFDPYASITDGDLTIDMKVRSANDHDVVDPLRDKIMRTTKTFPITVQPPADVADWLMPRCTSCGR